MNIMMRTLWGACFWIFLISPACSESTYLTRFLNYLSWNQALPETPTPDFTDFIREHAPLSNKLREKWLYKLAQNADWPSYVAYYQDTQDIQLQCFQQIATFHLNQINWDDARAIWLTGENLPKACDPFVRILFEHHQISDDLLLKRIAMALEQQNISLAKYLVAYIQPTNTHEQHILESIQKSPPQIVSLSPSRLHSYYYLYGLKRLVVVNPKRAIKIWHDHQTTTMLSYQQKQSFLRWLARYQAIRNQKDAYQWFSQIELLEHDEALLDWQIRFAIKNHQWSHLKKLIALSSHQDSLAWQYWLARAEVALGHPQQGIDIYRQIANKRHFYGFLASVQIKKPLSFEEESTAALTVLDEYQPVLNRLKTLYQTNHYVEASRMANDFSSELPKATKSAFAAWLQQTLNWTEKAVYLSNDDLLEHQLTLRFPVIYQKEIHKQAIETKLPEALIYAVIRQESAFKENVISSAGAYGLMQILPKTAKQIARKQHIPYQTPADLFNPSLNIRIGSTYLAALAKQFHGNPLLMVAAYNAGPGQAKRWLKNQPIEEIDVWVETIPWAETRNYLKGIIAFYAVYQYRLQQKPNLSVFIEQDLHHNKLHKGEKQVTRWHAQKPIV